MAAPIFILFFQTQQPVVIPGEQDPAGDDYRQRWKRRRGIRPDPFDPWTGDDELPLVARELAGWPDELPVQPSMAGLPEGAPPVQMGAEDVLARMLGAPARPSPPQRRYAGPAVPITGPPMAPVQEGPDEALRRMLISMTNSGIRKR